MEIRSGTTRERLIRTLLFLVLVTFFAAYFAYDGMYGYPAKNVKWARQAMPDSAPHEIQPNPRVVSANLARLSEDMSVEEIKNLLGEPAMIQPRQAIFQGEEIEVSISLDAENSVLSVKTDQADPAEERADVSGLVNRKRADRIEKGMSFSKVRLELGRPAEMEPKSLWYVGPASYARIPIDDGMIAETPTVKMSTEYTENDIWLQKVIAVILGIVTVVFLVHLFRVVTTKAVVDEQGVKLNGRQITWAAMQRLETDEYKDKGWVDLVYQGTNGREETVRIDSYHYDKFDEMINAICAKKGWVSPIQGETDSAAENANTKESSADEPSSISSPEKENR
jgi:hypothetical protein